MRMGSLFAGIGGFDLAAERVGIEVAWQCENNQYASKVLANHWPDIINYGDIHELRDPAPVSILAGGFPCQDYSVAGKRGGLAGDRGALWWEYLRLIGKLHPTWVVGENVPGLIASRGGKDFETIIRSLTECGYGVAWAVLDAQYFGVAQRRRRVFIVGHSGGQPRPEILALSEGLFGHPAPSRKTREEATNAITSRIGGSGADDGYAEGGWLVGETIPSLRGSFDYDHIGDEEKVIGFNSAQDPTSYDDIANPLDQNSRASQAVAFTQNQRGEVGDLEGRAGALAADPGMKQQTYVAQVYSEGSKEGYREGDVVEAITEGAGSRRLEQIVATPKVDYAVRRLTPLECERLQGFPDNWTKVKGVSMTQRYKQLGNAVAVPVAEYILRRIMEGEKNGPQ